MLAPSVPAELVRHLYKESRTQKTIIHIDNVFAVRTYALALFLSKSLAVAQAHGDVRPDIAYKIHPGVKTLAKMIIAPILLKHLKHIWVLRKDDHDWVNQFVPTDKIDFLTVGVDKQLFYPHDKTECRIQIGLPRNEKVICYVGKGTYENGVDYVIQSYLALKAEGLQVHLLLVGL